MNNVIPTLITEVGTLGAQKREKCQCSAGKAHTWLVFLSFSLLLYAPSEPGLLPGIQRMHYKCLQPQPDLARLSVVHHQRDTH